MTDLNTTPMIEHGYDYNTWERFSGALNPEFLKDLGTIVLEPISEPTDDQLGHATESGETIVNIAGLWYHLTTLDDVVKPLGKTESDLRVYS